MLDDKFKKQVQAILTTYYEDIRSIQGFSLSCCPKPKFVTRSFVGTEDPGDASKHNNGSLNGVEEPRMDLIQVGVSVTGSKKKRILCVSPRAGPAQPATLSGHYILYTTCV
jgi:hypothetical protein